MKNILITTEDQKLMEFFNSTIPKEIMAKHIRRAVYIMSKVAIDKNYEEEGKIYVLPEWIKDGFYWLNEFAEILDPYLDKELE
ncbi:hypothetical protein B0A58_01520 [Flavobacterium branchiophilum NBRC 15030 = ATCC 35035]|uniref:Phage protein n=1 Tax=Flavobacterium branchiophilum TaxID=55197 RepID=A0A543G168_9FLAO|nr:hypothetical protein [Flavobacterium branchiophilum]OXA81209.1 hypothetical protein B0A58_01520 [Flavobacterium branchiophilum NBRC 15030 = ATCC 35035]TQM39764.1 hypothetical protein BC670_0595 [Flavobacterium branchiophilum]GEM55198.1 hypothetical protein FB1_14190 [Flavobacterium branchiophilum NBRC 15030 = ATCC 35035]